MTGLSVSEAARLWVGTPYVHQGRLKGPDGGTDCVGLLIGVGKETGFVPEGWESPVYGDEPPPEALDDELRLWAEPVPFEVAAGALVGEQPGDILVIGERHTAFVSRLPDFALGMIHASRDSGTTVEHRIGGKWPGRVRAVYRPRGLSVE